MKIAFRDAKKTFGASGTPLPKNSRDKLRRPRDRLVIEYAKEARLEARRKAQPEERLRVYDTVRGVFVEGSAAYSGAGFQEKTHIQLCVINPQCIKAVFRVNPAHLA